MPLLCPISPQLGQGNLCCLRYVIPKFGETAIGGITINHQSSTPDTIPVDYEKNTTEIEERAFVFVSEKYAKYIESFWICSMIDKVVGNKVFEWYTETVLETQKQLHLDAALVKCYEDIIPQIMDYWRKHLKRLYEFSIFIDDSMKKIWDIMYMPKK
jgi:hypothetical protein